MRNNTSRFFALVTVLWVIALFATACTTVWTSEAINIIQLVVPAITGALSILTAFGAGVSPAALQAVQSWGTQAAAGLQEVAGLIEQYNTADKTAQPGLLEEIKTGLNVIVSDAQTVLADIHITNAATQAKIIAVFDTVISELGALINLVPALKGEVTSHEELKKLVAAVKSPKEFKNDYNSKVEEFGKQYRI